MNARGEPAAHAPEQLRERIDELQHEDARAADRIADVAQHEQIRPIAAAVGNPLDAVLQTQLAGGRPHQNQDSIFGLDRLGRGLADDPAGAAGPNGTA